MAGGPQQKVLERVPRSVREKPGDEGPPSPAAGAVQIQPLDGKPLGGVAVDLDVAFLGQKQGSVVFVHLDVDRPLPIGSALGIVAVGGMAGHVDAPVRIEEIRGLNRQRNHRHGIAPRAARMHPEGARDCGAGQSPSPEGPSSDHPALVHFACRRQPSRHGRDLGNAVGRS